MTRGNNKQQSRSSRTSSSSSGRSSSSRGYNASQPSNGYTSRYTNVRSESQKLRDDDYFRKQRRHYEEDAFSTEGIPLLAQEKAKERNEATRLKNRKRVIRLSVILGIVVFLVAAMFVVYNSSLFKITAITVKGNEHLSSTYLSEIASVTEGETLLRVNISQVKERIAEDPWVYSVEVSRQWPDTLSVTIVERQVAVYVEVPKSNFDSDESDESKKIVWAVSTDGYWLEKCDGKTKDHQHITKIAEGVVPVAGELCEDKGILNVVEIVCDLSTKFLKKISYFEAETVEQTTFYLKSGVTIAFGSSEDATVKEAVINELLTEHKNKVAYINVRVASTPAWRGLTDDE